LLVSQHPTVLKIQRYRCIDATMQDVARHSRPNWQRKLDLVAHRARRFVPLFEIGMLVVAVLIAILTYFAIMRGGVAVKPIGPASMALMLIANLIPAVTLLVLMGRRVAQGRAAKSPIGGRGRLHVRLVALFSLIAAIPMLLMVIFASLLFQYGVEVWYTDRARSMFENTVTLAQELYAEKQQRVMDETEAMATDISGVLAETPIDSRGFVDQFLFQVYRRELSEGAVLAITPKNGVQTLAVINPYERETGNWVPLEIAKKLTAERQTVFRDSGGRMEAITPLPNSKDLFLYGSRVADTETLTKAKRASVVLKNFDALIGQSRALQLRFNAALYFLTLLIVGIAVLTALRVADRLVRPVGELVSAARRVAAGDLSARVPGPKTRDEVGTLSNAFNRMTGRLSTQTQELVTANELLDRRRALIEAVLSGVSAGVIAVNAEGDIRIMNSSASTLLSVQRDTAPGVPLIRVVPELAALLDSEQREGIVQISTGDGARTLAVKVVRDEVGQVLTFDDITQQLSDQRRAAWSDVARRVAHEIKNPLTPIQLAAERLRRRFGKEIVSDPGTFERLTDTIVRQVNDLRSMVDEFSSFARMPKPVFGDESLVDIAREALFLHEVANPGINFRFDAPDPQPRLICDRRQLTQALSNVVKNGVEAIQQRFDEGEVVSGKIELVIQVEAAMTSLSVSDTGIGLPVERDRIIEPYMTTRAGGTGLGLAIVKKIIEEHMGEIRFADREGGGTTVTLAFDQEKQGALGRNDAEQDEGGKRDVPSELTRVRIG
jgi:two-component system, NtrC family, nitrogen regulation sensor histidine kinase NtrY